MTDGGRLDERIITVPIAGLEFGASMAVRVYGHTKKELERAAIDRVRPVFGNDVVLGIDPSYLITSSEVASVPPFCSIITVREVANVAVW